MRPREVTSERLYLGCSYLTDVQAPVRAFEKTPGRFEKCQNQTLAKNFRTAIATKFIFEGRVGLGTSFRDNAGSDRKVPK
jgi:hypothetical protein